MVSDIFGESQPVSFAHRGDVVIRFDEETKMQSLGICVGDLAAFPAAKGVAYISVEECLACWKV